MHENGEIRVESEQKSSRHFDRTKQNNHIACVHAVSMPSTMRTTTIIHRRNKRREMNKKKRAYTHTRANVINVSYIQLLLLLLFLA